MRGGLVGTIVAAGVITATVLLTMNVVNKFVLRGPSAPAPSA